jgi:hypothetical protein
MELAKDGRQATERRFELASLGGSPGVILAGFGSRVPCGGNDVLLASRVRSSARPLVGGSTLDCGRFDGSTRERPPLAEVRGAALSVARNASWKIEESSDSIPSALKHPPGREGSEKCCPAVP